jgi:acetyl esterase/lipase
MPAALSEQSDSKIGGDGTVHVPAFDAPLSSYMSEEAKSSFIHQKFNPPPMQKIMSDPAADIATVRAAIDKYFFGPMLERSKALYPVTIEDKEIAGVRATVVTPKTGLSAANRERVLINLHGGGFTVGAGLGGLAESVPVASVGKITVISVDYRQGPEHKFPAASEDVAAVYKELLKRYKAEKIGIYGCSAGGVLTAMAVAWFQKQKLPRPGAIGIFCAGADGGGGDSRFTAAALTGETPPPADESPLKRANAYIGDADRTDPLISPARSRSVIAAFPPTLLIASTRDNAFSSTINTQRVLVRAGVEADLHLWDGLWHGFIYDPELPESKEAYDVIATFFDKHLAK